MINDEEITALANGMAPFVRECVAQSLRLPPELALQVAGAVRLLHESPVIEQRSDPPPAAPKLTRIERDEKGNFVPVYGDPPTHLSSVARSAKEEARSAKAGTST